MLFRHSRPHGYPWCCSLLLEAAMTPQKDSCLEPCPPLTPGLPPLPVLADALHVCHPHAAGIDLGAAEHWVAVPPGRDPQPVRRFGTGTADLDAVADWLLDGRVPTVAMASTGVSWIPLCALLEARGVQVPPDRSASSHARSWTAQHRSARWPVAATLARLRAARRGLPSRRPGVRAARLLAPPPEAAPLCRAP